MWNLASSLWPAALAGALLVLKSQLAFLVGESWEQAGWRLGLAPWVGLLAGGLLAWLAGLPWRDPARRAQARAHTAWTMLLAAPILWFHWSALETAPWLLVLVLAALLPLCLDWPGWRGPALGFWALALAAHLFWGPLAGAQWWPETTPWLAALAVLALDRLGLNRLEPQRARRLRQWGLLALVLLLAWGVRLAGVDHGLPQRVYHPDTPKQFMLMPYFLQGDLTPPDSYPVGHIYLYSALTKWLGLAGQVASPWLDALGRTPPDGAWPLIARLWQTLAGLGLVVGVFLVGRALAGWAVGLLAACLAACDPLVITYARQVMGETPQTMLVLISLWASMMGLARRRDAWFALAGLCAGLAVAVKMYGGYIMVAAGLAGLLLPGWAATLRAWTVAGGFLILGVVVGTPAMWADPVAWFWRFQEQSRLQYNYINVGTTFAEGMHYLWHGTARRLGVAWTLLGFLGLGWAACRARGARLVFLSGPAALLTILVVFRYAYLRQWDLVGLTPYLALGAAWLLVESWRRQPANWRRPVLAGAMALALAGQTAGALGEAWLALLPDTTQAACDWVLGHHQGGPILMQSRFANGRWLPETWDDRRELWHDVADLPADPRELDQYEMVLVERNWFAGPLPPGPPAPVEVFARVNHYWENLSVAVYLPKVPAYHGQLIWPHVRAAWPWPRELATPWAASQPSDLLAGDFATRQSRLAGAQVFTGDGADRAYAWVALGRGRAALYHGPEVGRPLEPGDHQAQAGLVHPWRRGIPWTPATRTFHLAPRDQAGQLWVGLYPDPAGALPLLARLGQWDLVLRLAQDAQAADGAGIPAEARLFLAGAQAAQGHASEAQATLAALRQAAPDFLDQYRRLAAAGPEGLWAALAPLSNATPTLLAGQRTIWPAPDRAYLPPHLGWPEATEAKDATHHHLWLSPAHLPGRLRLVLDLEPLAAPAVVRVHGVMTGQISRELTRAELPAGTKRAELFLDLDQGPLKLEVDLAGADGPRVRRLELSPDLAGEFAWRWRTLAGLLGL